MTKKTALPKWVSQNPSGVLLKLYIQPKASRSEVVGEYGTGESARLKVRIAAPPVDGAANEEVVRFFKKITGTPSARIQIIRGETSKLKDVFFQGATIEEIIGSVSVNCEEIN